MTLDHFLFATTLSAALGSGLIAGVFFAFSVFVMKALARLAPPQGISAMQSINLVVLNPGFLGVFLGTAALAVLAAGSTLIEGRTPDAPYLVIGAVLYVAGCLGVTLACNVPRNNALAAVAPAAPGSARLWSGYVVEWTAWNHVRTVASLAAAVAFSLALVERAAA